MDTPRLTPSVSSHNSNVPSPIRVPSPEKWQAQKVEDEPVTARAAAIEVGEVEDEAFAAKTEQLALGTTPQDAYVMPTFGGDRGQISKPVEGGGMGKVVVISGGSGYNDLVGATPEATFVMPISDNGGSSSEIIRVLGGPSIGDLRSRLVRLIPVSAHQPEIGNSNDAVHRLLAYRLPSTGSSKDIKQEWMDILEGRHKLWRGIEPERKECIRGEGFFRGFSFHSRWSTELSDKVEVNLTQASSSTSKPTFSVELTATSTFAAARLAISFSRRHRNSSAAFRAPFSYLASRRSHTVPCWAVPGYYLSSTQITPQRLLRSFSMARRLWDNAK